MNEALEKPDWVRYLEIPVKTTERVPVKLDEIIAKRLKAFMKAKKARLEATPNHPEGEVSEAAFKG